MLVGIHDSALDAVSSFDLQLFTEDDDLGPALEIDVDALGDDPGRLKSMLGKALHENKKVRQQAGSYRTKLRAAETERDDFKGKLTTADTEKTEIAAKLETANRANGQYRTNFKTQRIEDAVKAALQTAGAIDVDLVAGAIPKDKIACDDETFAVSGVDDVVKAFQAEKAHLFGKTTQAATGTNRSGTGPTGTQTGTAPVKPVDYRDTTKSLEDLERESNMAMFGRSSIGGGV